MTLLFSLSWLYHVFDNFQTTSKQKPWTPRSNINHHTARWVVPMFLSCFTISRSRAWWLLFGPVPGPSESIRVICWNHGNHHPKQLLLNFWGFKKNNSWKLCTEKFKAGLCLRSLPSTNGDSHGIHVAVLGMCMFFFSICFCINSACNISF